MCQCMTSLDCSHVSLTCGYLLGSHAVVICAECGRLAERTNAAYVVQKVIHRSALRVPSQIYTVTHTMCITITYSMLYYTDDKLYKLIYSQEDATPFIFKFNLDSG